MSAWWRWALGGAGAVVLTAIVAVLVGLWPSGGALSREELLSRGDEICGRAHEAFTELQQDPPRTAGEAAEVTERLISIAEDELDEIAELDGPASLDNRLARYLELREAGIERMRDGLSAAEAGDSASYERAQADLASTQRSPRLRAAQRVGFESCSRPIVVPSELRRQSRSPRNGDPDARAAAER